MDEMMDRLIAGLQARGQPREDHDWLSNVFGKGPEWEEAGVPVKEAVQALSSAAQFLTLGNNQADPVRIVSSSGLTAVAAYGGSNVDLSLRRSDSSALWGQWSSYFVDGGPTALLGKRLVAADRKPENTIFGPSGSLDTRPGDVLYFAGPARAAFLELATYDRLPEMSARLAQLVKQSEAGGGDFDAIAAPREMTEAARFVNRLDLLPSDGDRVRARMRRLQDYPAFRALERAARAEEGWAELVAAVEPKAEQLYSAARGVAPDIPQVEPRQVSTVRVSVLGLLVVIALLGGGVYWSSQLFQQWSQVRPEDLPMYSLDSGSTSRLVPLSSMAQLTTPKLG